MCDNNSRCRRRTSVTQLVLVVVLAVAVTAPLIQNVACLANDAKNPAAPATLRASDISAAPAGVKLLPPFASLVKRDVTNAGNTGSAEDDDGSRVARNGGDLDFDAYVNDFNMQDEASIPEDIVDQQHIQEGDMQYATEPEATDVILETQSQSRKKVNTFGMDNDENNNSDSPNSKNLSKANKNKKIKSKINDKNLKSEKFNNKKREYKDELAIADYDDGDDVNDSADSDGRHNEEDGINDELATAEKAESEYFGEQGLDMSGEKVVREKMEGTKVGKSGQEQSGRQWQHDEQLQANEQHQTQLHGILKLNERKFNKVPSKMLETTMTATEQKINNGNSVENSNTANKGHEQQAVSNWSYEEDSQGYDNIDALSATAVAAVAAIGDIQDNFRNEDEAFTKAIDRAYRTENFENEYGSISNSNSNSNDDDVNDNISVNDKSATEQRSMSALELNGQQSGSPAIIVGKKTKRFNRVRTFNSGDHSLQSHHENEEALLESEQKNKRSKEHETDAAKTDDYTIKRYELRQNGSNTFKATRNISGREEQRQQQQENEYAAENANNGQTNADLATMRSGISQHQQQQNLSLDSAFEKHKARRRNNRRNGHKSHKKRYKDYLRFAMTPDTAPTIMVPLATKTTPTIVPARNTNEQTAMAAAAAGARTDETPTNGTNSGEAEAALAKLTNNLKQIYQSKHEADIGSVDENAPATVLGRAEKLRKYARKLEAEKSRGLPASPIFAVANRNAVSTTSPRLAGPTKPFYEGQINYYVETKDDYEPDSSGGIGAMAETSNWYRRVSPVLRNGVKTSNHEVNVEPPLEHRRKHHHHHHEHQHEQSQPEHNKQPHHQHQHQHNHHHQQHPHSQHHQRAHHKHQQANKQYQSAHSNPYQRKLVRKPAMSGSSHVAPKGRSHMSTPLPPPAYKPHEGAMQELGHQITEMEELERYYAKWPHLARVQLQVYDEHFREQHPEIYPDYDQDYESAAELEEAQNANAEDANLPPYIKKYNRRNKQLLNLLEGTLPPPTKPIYYSQGRYGSMLQPGPHESSSGTGHSIVRIDDDYMKEKRRRYHSRYGNGFHKSNSDEQQHDLFAQQRGGFANANENTTNTPATLLNNQQKSSAATQKTTVTADSSRTAQPHTLAASQNQLPEEDVGVSQEERGDEVEATDWQEEIETKSNGNAVDEMTGSVQMAWQIEKLTTPPTLSTTTSRPKSALFRLPSYPAISGSFIGKPRSRSSQFAPSSRANSYLTMHSDDYSFEKMRQMSGATRQPPPPPPPPPQPSPPTFSFSTSAPGISTMSATLPPATPTPSKAISSFVYHRVVDSAPRFVGAGATGLKQRLPFVAITDRRLETARKTLMEHKKDLEQNFYPMP